ncbi:MAG: flagellar assembly protein FliW, partial [Planctomycetaceae bacterium]|nr:flagellar assembly protein FliW [Planctomycetaceae bacterium]
VSKNNKGLTLNLKAPIVINLEDRTGRQVVANGDLSLDQQLDHTLATLKKSA